MHTPDKPLSTAALIEAHPVLRRLTGQVIWVMFEEAEATPEAIQAFLDRYEQVKAETLPLVEAALDPGAAPLVRIETDGPGRRWCEHCARMHDKLLRLDGPQALAFLPPYSMGCRARAVAADDAAPDTQETVDRAADAPPGKLLCGEWVFSHPWDSETG